MLAAETRMSALVWIAAVVLVALPLAVQLIRDGG